MGIYTKLGDSGTSGLIGGTRVSKDDIRLEAYGSIDELNSFLGLLYTENLESHDEMIQTIESEIDHIVSSLPEIKKFILPGGNKPAAICHICRTVCRRAERNVVKVSKTYFVQHNIVSYLNRLSDYFFVLGRKACLQDNSEIFWNNTK
jgi:cob(I)alamin adenosyltransferase